MVHSLPLSQLVKIDLRLLFFLEPINKFIVITRLVKLVIRHVLVVNFLLLLKLLSVKVRVFELLSDLRIIFLSIFWLLLILRLAEVLTFLCWPASLLLGREAQFFILVWGEAYCGCMVIFATVYNEFK